ncbi:hypothetical protein OF83DRAFT_768569 [Amylostereum chailletii]|nr:hypothetical protein OF83DRAFT_768569 [Amylostereum chailletii]
MKNAPSTYSTVGLVTLSLTSLWLTLLLLSLAQSDILHYHTKPIVDVGRFTLELSDDVVPKLPLASNGHVHLRVEETVHYDQTHADGDLDWMASYPKGDGSVRTGPNHRAGYISMYHQLHCVQSLSKDVIVAKRSRWGHIQHCLNYLRQMALCRPDLTLEPGDFSMRNFTKDRTGALHVCKDWNLVHDALTRNWEEWDEWYHIGKKNGIPSYLHDGVYEPSSSAIVEA